MMQTLIQCLLTSTVRYLVYCTLPILIYFFHLKMISYIHSENKKFKKIKNLRNFFTASWYLFIFVIDLTRLENNKGICY